MHPHETRTHGRVAEGGFALILAMLSLLLLTFLGLTLAATTSTELQIASNQRWSQQARYNAEAGLQAAQIILRDIATQDSYSLVQALPPRQAARLADRLLEDVFHLGIDAPHLVGRPFLQGVVELGVEPQKELLLIGQGSWPLRRRASPC